MNSTLFPWRTLKTRVTIFTLAIFLLSIGSLSFYTSRMLHQDMERLLGEQQFTTVSLVASEVNHEMDFRLQSLDNVAKLMTPAMLNNTAALQTLLAQHPVTQSLFNGGILVINPNGIAIADVPRSAQRIGIDYSDRDYLKVTLTQGKPAISPPLMGKKPLQPIVGMSVPIRHANGQVLGALTGVINLGLPNFLDRITENNYGKTGGTFLVTPQNRMIASASDKTRIMEELPAPGINPWIDRFMQGYEGSAVVVNPHGLEILVSVKQVPIAGWYTSVILPTAEAFAPIHALQQRMLFAAILLTLLAGSLTWWMLRRQLAPLLDTAKTLVTLTDANQPLQALPIARQDEIGVLIGGFNQLLHNLAQRQEALQESEGRFRALADNASSLVWMASDDKLCYYFNKIWLEFTGRSLEQEQGNGWAEGVHPDDLQRCLATYVTAFDARQAFNMDYRLRQFDGEYRWLADHGVPRYDDQGVFLGYIGTCIDITERKRAEEKLQLAASVFTHTREGIMITAFDGTIIDTNDAFTRITGFSRDDVLGQKPSILKSGRHDKAYYDAMKLSLLEHGHWYGEIWNRRHNGEIYPEMLTISAVRDAQGNIRHYVALFSDITASKKHEDELEHIAHYDALTDLPNRSLLADRLHQALLQMQRRGLLLAVVFLDLDGFKVINDHYGHEAGDQLLMTVAQRMKQTLREGDTLARIGGDEFVAVLIDLPDTDASVPMLKRLLAAAAQPLPLGEVTLQVSASLGVTFYPQADDMGADQLLRQADQAMYQAKLAGKNRYHVFDAHD